MTSLDHIAAVVAAYDHALSEAATWAKAAEVLRKRVETEMGDHQEATIGGETAFTWRRTGKFSAARFAKDFPDLAARYTATVTRDEVDTVALAEAHPEVYAACRSRVFLRKTK